MMKKFAPMGCASHARRIPKCSDRTALAQYLTGADTLTTERQEAKKNEGRAAGARAWMVKPFTMDQLKNAVNKLTA